MRKCLFMFAALLVVLIIAVVINEKKENIPLNKNIITENNITPKAFSIK